MTVADLIRELQSHAPHLPVKVCMESVMLIDEGGETEIPLAPECDASVADVVRYEGSHVLIMGRNHE